MVKKWLLLSLATFLIPLCSACSLPFGTSAPLSCTVGARGYSANITFTGDDSEQVCNQLTTQPGSAYYRYEGTPTGSEVCAGDWTLKNGHIVHYVVRGTGNSLISAENVICRTLSGG